MTQCRRVNFQWDRTLIILVPAMAHFESCSGGWRVDMFHRAERDEVDSIVEVWRGCGGRASYYTHAYNPCSRKSDEVKGSLFHLRW